MHQCHQACCPMWTGHRDQDLVDMQIAQYKDRLIRTLADMENSRQRSAQQAENSKRFAVQVCELVCKEHMQPQHCNADFALTCVSRHTLNLVGGFEDFIMQCRACNVLNSWSARITRVTQQCHPAMEEGALEMQLRPFSNFLTMLSTWG